MVAGDDTIAATGRRAGAGAVFGGVLAYRYHNPVSVHFGAGSLAELASALGGRSAVLVTFPEARGLGLVDRVRAVLGNSLAGVEEATTTNPDVAELVSLHERFWREHGGEHGAIVALGGGSVIDTAKVLMVATGGGSTELFAAIASGKAFRPQRVKPLIAVPTTAGTGSEVTPWATVWERAANRKHSLHLPETWPEAAIVDPELMRTLPAPITVQSGLDALSHALESIWNVNHNPISDTLAVGAARRVLATLPALMADLKNPRLRADMALAALQAGLAFSNTKTALAHSISYEMTLRFGLPHGIACSFTLPMVLERARGRDAGRDAILAQVFDGDLAGAPARLREFLRAVGVKTEFADYGVAEEDSRRMVAQALEGVRGRNFIGAAP